MTTLEHDLTLEEEQRRAIPPEQLALPMIDGRGIDLLEVGIGGTIKLDRGDPNDVALIRRLAAGKNVTLKVEVFVAGSGGEVSRDENGYAKETTLKKRLIVTGLDRPAGDVDDE